MDGPTKPSLVGNDTLNRSSKTLVLSVSGSSAKPAKTPELVSCSRRSMPCICDGTAKDTHFYSNEAKASRAALHHGLLQGWLDGAACTQ